MMESNYSENNIPKKGDKITILKGTRRGKTGTVVEIHDFAPLAPLISITGKEGIYGYHCTELYRL